MALPSDQIPPDVGALMRRIDDLDRKVQELAAARSAEATTIGRGGLVVKNGGEVSVLHDETGHWIFHVGKGAQDKYFVTMRRDTGPALFEVGTATNGQQFGAMWDNSGHVVVSDDAASGQGLARPWLAMSAGMPVLFSALPMTNSASYVSVWSAGFPRKQQPFMEVTALLRSDSGATGNARYVVNGVQVGSTMTIGAGAFAWQTWQTIELPGAWDSILQIELQVQDTNATGTVGGVFYGTFRQS